MSSRFSLLTLKDEGAIGYNRKRLLIGLLGELGTAGLRTPP